MQGNVHYNNYAYTPKADATTYKLGRKAAIIIVVVAHDVMHTERRSYHYKAEEAFASLLSSSHTSCSSLHVAG